MENNKLLIPSAIVVAGLLIAGALFFSGGEGTPTTDDPVENGEQGISINPVTSEDHILGNPDAQIKIVEYSDIDCPFCTTFHNTMHRIIDEYGPSGEVAWVYRHFPIEQLHPDAPAKALASECVADLGGNEAFWTFVDTLFEREDETLADLPQIAQASGVNQSEFESCFNNAEFEDQVREDFADAQRAGARGTPHSIMVTPSGELVPITGAQPYETVKQAIDAALSASQ